MHQFTVLESLYKFSFELETIRVDVRELKINLKIKSAKIIPSDFLNKLLDFKYKVLSTSTHRESFIVKSLFN